MKITLDTSRLGDGLVDRAMESEIGRTAQALDAVLYNCIQQDVKTDSCPTAHSKLTLPVETYIKPLRPTHEPGKNTKSQQSTEMILVKARDLLYRLAFEEASK